MAAAAAHPSHDRHAPRTRRRWLLALGVALPLAAAASLVPRGPVEGTTVVWLDDDALIDLSDRIVHGEVVAKSAHWDPATRRVYTTYTFRPFEVFKRGAGAATVTFREWGGEANGVRCWIPGAGKFEVGQEVVAFLGRPDPRTGVGFTTGLAQGKFTVRRTASGASAVRELSALSTVQADGRTPRPHPPADERPLDALLRRIRARCGR